MIRFFFILNLICSLVFVITLIAAGADPSRYWLFSISSLLVPIIIVIHILFAVFWLLIKWRYAISSILLLIFAIPQLRLMVAFNDSSIEGKCSNSAFTVMSFNLYGLKNIKIAGEQNQALSIPKFLSFIRQHNPDILCVQENNFYADEAITKSALYPYTHFDIQHGASIYSRYPIIDKGFVEFGRKTNSCLWADILVDGKKIRFYSVHLESNRVSKDVETITDKEDDPERLAIVRRMLRNYKNSSIIRAQQTKMILDHAQTAKNPVVIAGDFNDTPFSYVYSLLSEKYKDSFLERGSGFGSTFVGALPGLRIDFVWGGKKHFEFCFHRVLSTSFSDHNPILVKLYSRI